MAGKKINLLLAGGSCGNTLNLIADHLESMLEEWGHPVKITIQNMWQHHGPPPSTDLVLQTMPVYCASEIHCPVLSVRPMIRDREDPQTIEAIREAILILHEDPNAVQHSALLTR